MLVDTERLFERLVVIVERFAVQDRFLQILLDKHADSCNNLLILLIIEPCLIVLLKSSAAQNCPPFFLNPLVLLKSFIFTNVDQNKDKSILQQLPSIQIMGSGQSKSAEILKYFDKEWEYLRTTNKGVKVYRNRDSDKHAEQHSVPLDPHNPINKEYDIYNYRRTQDNALVAAYAVENLKDTSPNLCGNKEVLKVMTEHIPIRLEDINRLTFKESLYVMSESFRGFDDCYGKIGYFDINERMMGLNNNGQLKVWLTQHFAQNHPQMERPILQVTAVDNLRKKSGKQEENMLKQVVSIVEQKCYQRFPPDFNNKIQGSTNFVEAYQTVEEYCLGNQIDVPDRLVIEKYTESNNNLPLKSNANFLPNTSNVQNFSFQNPNNYNNGPEERQTLIKNLAFTNNNFPQSQSMYIPNPNPYPNSNNGFVQTGFAPTPISFDQQPRVQEITRTVVPPQRNTVSAFQSPKKFLKSPPVIRQEVPFPTNQTRRININYQGDQMRPQPLQSNPQYFSPQGRGYTSGNYSLSYR